MELDPCRELEEITAVTVGFFKGEMCVMASFAFIIIMRRTIIPQSMWSYLLINMTVQYCGPVVWKAEMTATV